MIKVSSKETLVEKGFLLADGFNFHVQGNILLELRLSLGWEEFSAEKQQDMMLLQPLPLFTTRKK